MKKSLTMALLSLTLLSMFTGCANAGTPSKTSTDTPTDTSSNQSQSKSEEKADKKEDKQEPTPVVKWYVAGDKAQDFDKVMESLNEDLKEKINVQLDLQFIANGEFNDKMRLISSSGEEYDLTFTSNWRNNFYDNMAREAFLDITDIYKEYGKDIAAQIPEWLTSVATYEDRLYAVPNYQVTFNQLGLSVQKEYLDKYNFDLNSVKIPQDLEPFLEQIATNEPTLYGIDLRQSWNLFNNYENLANEIAYVKRGDTSMTVVDGDEAMGIVDEELYRDWYKRGFVRQDIATVVDNTPERKANKYVCTLGTYKPGGEGEAKAAFGKEYVLIPVGNPYIKAQSGIETMTAFSATSKNPEAAMKLLNSVYSDKEIFNKLIFGLEGEHYTKLDDTHVEPLPDTKYFYGSIAWSMGNQFNAYYLPGQEDGIWEETDKLNKEAELSPVRGFVFDPAPVQAELAQVSAVAAEYKNYNFSIKDDTEYEKVKAERKEKMKKAGEDKIIEEAQRQVDEWAKANGKK